MIQSSNNSIARGSPFLTREQVRFGFEVEVTDHAIIVRKNGLLYQPYGRMTPIQKIHDDLNNAIEITKAVTMQPFRPEDFER